MDDLAPGLEAAARWHDAEFERLGRESEAALSHGKTTLAESMERQRNTHARSAHALRQLATSRLRQDTDDPTLGMEAYLRGSGVPT